MIRTAHISIHGQRQGGLPETRGCCSPAKLCIKNNDRRPHLPIGYTGAADCCSLLFASCDVVQAWYPDILYNRVGMGYHFTGCRALGLWCQTRRPSPVVLLIIFAHAETKTVSLRRINGAKTTVKILYIYKWYKYITSMHSKLIKLDKTKWNMRPAEMQAGYCILKPSQRKATSMVKWTHLYGESRLIMLKQNDWLLSWWLHLITACLVHTQNERCPTNQRITRYKVGGPRIFDDSNVW